MSRITYREASADDIEEMKEFIFDHGKCDWNHLPEDSVKRHLDDIKTKETEAVIATSGGKLIGFISFNTGKDIQHDHVPKGKDVIGWIAEAVVSREFVGRGIGTALLERVKEIILSRGVKTIYTSRHEDNKASARMMEKAGFKKVKTFHDPEWRLKGSRKTAVCMFVANK